MMELKNIQPYDVKFSKYATTDCPLVDVSGTLYHGSNIKKDKLILPKHKDDFWKDYGESFPSVYLTPSYSTAIYYSELANNPDRETGNYVHLVELDMPKVADCRFLINDRHDYINFYQEVYNNIKEAYGNDINGLIIPSTFGSTPEFVVFKPNEMTKVIGVRNLNKVEEEFYDPPEDFPDKEDFFERVDAIKSKKMKRVKPQAALPSMPKFSERKVKVRPPWFNPPRIR